MNRFLVLLIVLLLFSCGNKYNTLNFSTKNTWKKIESSDNSKPIARHEAAFVGVGDKFYLLGERGIRNVSIFDTKTCTWAKGLKPPIELHHFQPIVYGENIYIIGALTGKYPSEKPVKHIYTYNTEKNLWIKGNKIPENRLRGSTGNVLVNDIVYVACGISNGHIDGHKNWFDSYNLKTKEWQVLSGAPRARDHFQAVVHNAKIYILGGRQSKAPKETFLKTIGEVDVFDIIQKKWSTLKKNIPTKRAGNIAILYGQDILVIGGESMSQKTAHNEVEALNTETYEWKKYPSLIQGRHGTGALLFKDKIYIASGSGNRGGAPELYTMEKY